MKKLPVHTAPFSFLPVFVDEKGARSHCSVFKKIPYENDRHLRCSVARLPISKTVLLIPFSKQRLLFIAVNKAPIATLNTILIISLLTKECAPFSNVSAFGVHTENGSFSKPFSNSCVFIGVFEKLCFHSGAIESLRNQDDNVSQNVI